MKLNGLHCSMRIVKFHSIHTTTKIVKNVWFYKTSDDLKFTHKTKMLCIHKTTNSFDLCGISLIWKEKKSIFLFFAAWFRFCSTVRRTFGERLIILDAKKFTGHGIDWPPYSLDLNLCDFFLWGYIKDRIFRNPRDSLENLKLAIINTLQRVMTEFRNRLYNTIMGNSRHFQHLLY